MIIQKLRKIGVFELRKRFAGAGKRDLVQRMAEIVKASKREDGEQIDENGLSEILLEALEVVSPNFGKASFKNNFKVI
jgi:hypothetical protein